FDLGCNQIDLNTLSSADLPRLVPRQGVQPERVCLLGAREDGEPEDAGANKPAADVKQSEEPLPPLPPPPRRRGQFVARGDELERLAEILRARPDKGAGGRASLVGLRGIGGIGKTALAMRFAEEYQADFPGGILWGDMGTNRDAGERGADISPTEILRATL